jgi:hypothetical protein
MQLCICGTVIQSKTGMYELSAESFSLLFCCFHLLFNADGSVNIGVCSSAVTGARVHTFNANLLWMCVEPCLSAGSLLHVPVFQVSD